MANARVVETIKADAEAVWGRLGDFASIRPGPGIESVDYSGERVGMVRTIRLSNGEVVERLEMHDPKARTFTYAIINEDSPLPFSDYSATVSITDNGDGTSTVDWVGTFEPRDIDEAKAVRIATGIYANAIKGARIALGDA